ncbi:MAG TPA: hypothetical protein VMV06_01960 [Acidimicrobiales bacterium]|nr:hypothetical protein [Acidimicrobiales bacterium]
MPSVQIKDVPTDTHAVLRRRAAAAQQSLQEYLRNQLIEQARSSAGDDGLSRPGGWPEDCVPVVDAMRAIRH